MTREEALQRIVDNNFTGEYGFDLQILVDCMAVAREKILNSQFPSEDCISGAELLKHQRSIYDEHLMDYVDVVEVKCIEKMSSNKDIHECNNCHHFIDDGSNDKYCPCCGAKMEKSK